MQRTFGDPPHDRDLELERAILVDPADPQPWSVYADWLQGRGDPWGERITLELARERADERELASLHARLAQLDRLHRDAMLGPALAQLIDHEDLHELVQIDWRNGFVLGMDVVGSDEIELPLARVLAALFASPACILLQSLRFGVTDPDYPSSLRTGISQLAAGPVHEHLAELVIGEFAYPEEFEISWVGVGDLGAVPSRCPRLRSLHVRGADIELGDALIHPTLEQLVIETGGLPARAAAAIGRAWLPALRSMEVWFGQHGYGGEAGIADIAPLLSGEGVPLLRHLGLMNAEFEDEIAIALTRCPLLPRLASVSLAMGILRDRGGRALLDAAARLRHLERIDLDFNWLSADMAVALERALPNVHVGTRNEPPAAYEDEDDDDEYDGDYYTQVGE